MRKVTRVYLFPMEETINEVMKELTGNDTEVVELLQGSGCVEGAMAWANATGQKTDPVSVYIGRHLHRRCPQARILVPEQATSSPSGDISLRSSPCLP